MSQWIERESGGGSGRSMQPTEVEIEWFREHPALCEFMSLDRWSDGRPRKTSTVLLFWEAGCWKACLNDRDGLRVAFVTGASPVGLLQLLEARLQDEDLDWRPTRKFKG